MFDDQAGGRFGRQLLQGHNRPQQLAHVGHRQRRQDFDLKLALQLGIARVRLRPIQLGFRDEPQGQGVQRRVVAPGAVLASYQFVPATLRLAVPSLCSGQALEDALGEVPLAAP